MNPNIAPQVTSSQPMIDPKQLFGGRLSQQQTQDPRLAAAQQAVQQGAWSPQPQPALSPDQLINRGRSAAMFGASQQPNPQNSQLGLAPHHDAIYEKLRELFMQLHKSGVPGIDQLLATLNKTHVGLHKPPLGSQPASPQNPTPQGSYSGQ